MRNPDIETIDEHALNADCPEVALAARILDAHVTDPAIRFALDELLAFVAHVLVELAAEKGAAEDQSSAVEAGEETNLERLKAYLQAAASKNATEASAAKSGVRQVSLSKHAPGPIRIGRRPSSTILIEQAARMHAVIDSDNGRWRVIDLGTTAGTIVNGVEIKNITDVGLGDRVEIAGTILELVP